MTDTDGDHGSTREAAELIDGYWERLLELEPILGTQVGDERYDDRLADASEAGRARREAVHADALRRLAAIDRDRLDVTTRTTLDMLEAVARRDLDDVRYRFDRFGAVLHLWGPGSLLATLGTLQRADRPDRQERYLARLGAVPSYLDQQSDIAREAASVGQTVPQVVVDRTIGQVQRLVDAGPVDSPAMAPLDGAPAAAREKALGILRDQVMPAYERYLQALRDYRPSATETLGLSALKGGDEMYDALIQAWTTLDRSAAEIHQTGLDDLEAIQEELLESAARLGQPDADAAIAAYEATGANRAASYEDMVRLAEEQVERGWDAAPSMFGRLPRANCEVRPVEAFREADMPFAYYQAPSADGSRPGVYYVNTSDLGERPLHHLASTTYHEANPGHHFQTAIEQEIPDRPELRRFAGLMAGSAFIEGWGLYSERLADEMGLFLDEHERIGMLQAQAWRAARLVVDTGIHAFGWDRDRAIAQLEAAGVPHVDAVIETDRYIALPGQALSYKLGQLEIERWREEARSAEGSAFSLTDFHDGLLALGSLPLAAIERELSR